MNCETNRELLALRLYGELEGDEGERVDAHLASCAACRATAAELERGLGLLRAAPPALESPDSWARARFRGHHLAASFAAGLLVSWLLIAGLAARQATSEDLPPVAESSFRRAAPPPAASRPERLGLLGAWLRQ